MVFFLYLIYIENMLWCPPQFSGVLTKLVYVLFWAQMSVSGVLNLLYNIENRLDWSYTDGLLMNPRHSAESRIFAGLSVHICSSTHIS